MKRVRPQNGSLNVSSDSSKRLLFWELANAVRAEDLERVQHALAQGAPHKHGRDPHVITTAARQGNLPVLDLLLADASGRKPLVPIPLDEALGAATDGLQYDCAERLLAAGARPVSPDCISSPVSKGDVELVKLLLRHMGRLPRAEAGLLFFDFDEYKLPLSAAAFNPRDIDGENLEILDLLLRHEIGFQPPTAPDAAPLFHAARAGRVNAVKMMVERFNDAGSPYEADSVVCAAKIAHVMGHGEIVSYLIASNAVAPDVVSAAMPERYRSIFNARLLNSVIFGIAGDLPDGGAGRVNRLFDVGADIPEWDAIPLLTSKHTGLVPYAVKRMACCRPPGGLNQHLLSKVLLGGHAEYVLLLLNQGADFGKATPHSLRKTTPEIKAMLKSHARSQALLAGLAIVKPGSRATTPAASTAKSARAGVRI